MVLRLEIGKNKMSNCVYGYIQTNNSIAIENELESLARKFGVGLKNINKSELFSFPKELLPSLNDDSIIYINVSDSNTRNNAECLIDFYDYINDVKMNLPHSGLERLKILISIIREIFSIHNVVKIVLAMTECDQIESVKEVFISDFEKTIIDDFLEYAPPNIIYIIK